MSPTLTAVLAVWGGLTGSVALYNLVRERPRLRVLTELHMRGREHELVVVAVNHGRQPAVIIHAGLAPGVELVRPSRLRRRRPRITAEFGQPEADVLPKALAPSEAMRWSYIYNVKQGSLDAIAFVQDSCGRYTWASRRPPKPSPGAVAVARSFEVR